MFKGTMDRDRLVSTAAAGMPAFAAAVMRVEAMDHPMLENFRFETSDSITLVCRERSAASAADERPQADWTADRVADFCAAQAKWPLDHQSIRFDRQSGTVTIGAGHGGVAPLYVRVEGSRIDISWSIADFYADLSPDQVDIGRTGLRLTGTMPYAATTMFRSVFMVTERSTLSIDHKGHVTVVYPAPAPYYLPTPVEAGADIPAAAFALVDGLLQRWPSPPFAIASEFSGGLDSAVVAAVMARRHPGALPTYALDIEGAAHSQQARRRALAIDNFGFRDTVLPVGAVPMLPSAFAWQADYAAAPYNADLQRPLRRLLSAFVSISGARVVATGTGGDELLMAHAFEQDAAQLARNVNDAFLPDVFPPAMSRFLKGHLVDYAASCDRAPFPVLPISVLEAQAARAPLFAEYDLWPISPFAQPEAVRFYRSLPLVWRQQKALHRALLRHLGYPEPFLAAPLRENFEPYLTRSLVAGAKGVAQALAKECRLHDLGLVDADRMIAAVRAVRQDSNLTDVGFLFHAFNVEYLLKRLGERRVGASVIHQTG